MHPLQEENCEIRIGLDQAGHFGVIYVRCDIAEDQGWRQPLFSAERNWKRQIDCLAASDPTMREISHSYFRFFFNNSYPELLETHLSHTCSLLP